MPTAITIAAVRPSCFPVRRCSNRSCCFLQQRATQTLKLEEQNQQTPWLLLSSPDKPESRYLYDLTGTKGDPFIRFNRELHLPEIAGQKLIGCSQGYLLSLDDINGDIHATDPLTGATLQLPSMATLPNMSGVMRDSFGNITHYVSCPRHNKDDEQGPKLEFSVFEDANGWTTSLSRLTKATRFFGIYDMTHHYHVRAVLSPSLDAAIVIHGQGHVAFARLGSSSWAALRSPENYFHDLIFHHAVASTRSTMRGHTPSSTSTARGGRRHIAPQKAPWRISSA